MADSVSVMNAQQKRKCADGWYSDPLNPHGRLRSESWPVGLKNMGNTCWFSAVIQSLFFLPKFRKLILDFLPPELKDDKKSPFNLHFVSELRRLFALLIGSKRQYVEPSLVLEILNQSFVVKDSSDSMCTDNQQDVSEFQHKLIEWLEDAFRAVDTTSVSPASTATQPKEQQQATNPIIEMFYGEVLVEGIHAGTPFTKKETFGQFPLQVEGFSDVMESFEATASQDEIESANGENNAASKQEQWFSRLPPVLTLELSRFQFNQSAGRPDKIHNKFEFFHTIYLDRFMEKNRTVIRRKRKEIKVLKEEKNQLQKKLERFMNYGSGPKRFPIQDILLYALEFAKSSEPTTSLDQPMREPESHSFDVEMDSPKSQSSINTVPSSASSSATSSLNETVLISEPAPRHITAAERDTLESCLLRWRTDLESDIKAIQDRIRELDYKINTMYAHESLKQHPFRLHAVLIHEGQAASGHYWSCIYSHEHQQWLKFNDIVVSECSWDEIVREGEGGYLNASAYCLIYVNANNENIWSDAKLSDENLSPDLRLFVREDNFKLQKEIETWDAEHNKAPSGEAPATSPSEKEVAEEKPVCLAEINQSVPVSLLIGSPLIERHARLRLNATYRTILSVLENKSVMKSLSDCILEVCDFEVRRLTSIIQNPATVSTDLRLESFVSYLLINDIDVSLTVKRALIESIVLTKFNPQTHTLAFNLTNVAKQKLQLIQKEFSNTEESTYKMQHAVYDMFRKQNLILIKGLELFSQEKYINSLPYLHLVCQHNPEPEPEKHVSRGLDEKSLYHFRRQCILSANEYVASCFEESNSVDEILETMNRTVLPCLASLGKTPYPQDQEVLETVRDTWLNFLNTDMGNSGEKMIDFFSKLCDPPQEVKIPLNDDFSGDDLGSSLLARYNSVMNLPSIKEHFSLIHS